MQFVIGLVVEDRLMMGGLMDVVWCANGIV